jgi:hypothetical protein
MVAQELLRDNTGKVEGKVYLYGYPIHPALYEYNTLSRRSAGHACASRWAIITAKFDHKPHCNWKLTRLMIHQPSDERFRAMSQRIGPLVARGYSI